MGGKKRKQSMDPPTGEITPEMIRDIYIGGNEALTRALRVDEYLKELRHPATIEEMTRQAEAQAEFNREVAMAQASFMAVMATAVVAGLDD